MTTTDTVAPAVTEASRKAQPRSAASKKAAAKKDPTRKKAAPRAKKSAKPERSKTDTILALLRRRNGVTLATIMAATGWQAHSIRGFISLAQSRRGLKISSVKNTAGERIYLLAK